MKMSDSRRLFDSFNFKFSCSILLLSVTPHYRDDKLDQEQYFSFLTPEVLSFKDGLNLEKLVLFLSEIKREWTFAFMDHKQMSKSIAEMSSGNSEELNRFWHSVPSFLVAVANISKILCPSQWKYNGHLPDISIRDELRKLLGINDSSIYKSREFRDHFEHYDLRIEEWARNTTDGLIVDSNVVPSYLIAGYTKESTMRNFDPETQELSFHNRKYDIRSVVNTIQTLLENTNQVESELSIR